MFRITAHYDDRWHPLNGDVVTVASVSEAIARMGGECVPYGWQLEDLVPGQKDTFGGADADYTVERI